MSDTHSLGDGGAPHERRRRRHVSMDASDQVPATLYHYTSAAGLVGIVESGTLRASNFSFLNDSTEIEYGRGLARKVIDERSDAETDDFRRRVLIAARKELEEIGKYQEYYLACFCTEPDLLSQWRAYGGGPSRFCIGFDAQVEGAGLRYTLGRAVYEEQEQRRELERAIAGVLGPCVQNPTRNEPDDLALDLVDDLVHVLCFFKHAAFREEHEWRAVHLADGSATVRFDTSRGFVKPYVDIWVGREGGRRVRHLPLREVIVGSVGSVEQSVKSVELLLTKQGYANVQVRVSSVPFREL